MSGLGMRGATPLKLPAGVALADLYKPVVQTCTIRAAAETLWSVISRPGGAGRFHPFIADNPAREWSARQARDTLNYFSGMVLQREVYRWLPGEGYDLLIGATLDDPDGVVSWRIAPRSESDCELTISLYLFDRRGNGTPGAATVDRFTRYLDSVVRGARHVAETGEAVVENQFGAVEGFSREG